MLVPAVPVAVANEIVAHAPQLAYAPAQLPSGYRYASWDWSQYAGRIRIRFKNAKGKQIVFVSTWQYGSCPRGQEQTFRLGANTVYYGHRAQDQEAWRCVTETNDGSDIVVELTVDTAESSAKVPAAGLSRMVGTAQQLHYVQQQRRR